METMKEQQEKTLLMQEKYAALLAAPRVMVYTLVADYATSELDGLFLRVSYGSQMIRFEVSRDGKVIDTWQNFRLFKETLLTAI